MFKFKASPHLHQTSNQDVQPFRAAQLRWRKPFRTSPILQKSFSPACLALALLFGADGKAGAQATATATRAGDFQVGGTFSIANADYDRPTLRGGGLYATFDFKPNYGVEIDFHQVNAPSPSVISERSYEIGGRYVRHYGIFNPYGRVMVGRGVFNYQYNVANLAYNMGDLGVGVDVNATRRVNVRVDYEYQRWFGFRGFVNNGTVTSTTGSLTPQVFSIGAAYHFQ